MRYILMLLILLMAAPSWGATYLCQTAQGTADGSDAGNCMSLATFNSSATAGDTGYLTAGTYITAINPSADGVSGSPITYQRDPAAAEYSAVITNTNRCVDLTDDNYITIDGLYINNCGDNWVLIYDATNITVSNSKFYDSSAWGGLEIGGTSENVFIDNNNFVSGPLKDVGDCWDADDNLHDNNVTAYWEY